MLTLRPSTTFSILVSIEGLQQLTIRTHLWTHRAQQRHHRELAALVDANAQAVLLGDIDFDPTSTLGNHAATGKLAIGRRFDLLHEVDTRTAVQLADHHALGTIDNELTTAEHNGDIAEIDLFLDRLLAIQSQPNLHRLAVGQSQLATLVRRVARLAQFVTEVLQRDRLVVTLDREDLTKDRLQTDVLALF